MSWVATFPVRAAFLSDLHLGSPHCHAEQLAEFLGSVRCEQLYLVGDVFDLHWMTARRPIWCPAQTRVLDQIRRLVQTGGRVVYVPGNHDAPIRRWCGLMLPGVAVRRRAVHQTADGRRLLVTHGDEYDGDVRLGGVGEWIGEWLYERMLDGNRRFNRVRSQFGLRYFSLADFIKRRSRAAERYIGRYRSAALADVGRRGLDGVVCGHIHRPELRVVDGLIYANDGDWVENLTVLSELRDGTLALSHGIDDMRTITAIAPRVRTERAAA